MMMNDLTASDKEDYVNWSSLNSTSKMIVLSDIMERLRRTNLSTAHRAIYCSKPFVIEYLISNNSHNELPDEEYINNRSALRMFFYFLYALIFIIGVCGNTLVCYAVVRNRQMHTVTNLFITNLALSDILLCVFSVPFTPLYLIYYQDWVFGKALCALMPFAQGVSVYVSAFTLMSIAIDRYFVIIYPFKPRMKISISLMIVTFIWLAAAVLTFPYAWNVSMLPLVRNPCRLGCDEDWNKEDDRKTFGLSTSVLQFVIPFIIISFCYIRVCGKLKDRARSKPGEKSLKRDEVEKERTKRTNRMLISMVIIFGASWLPLNTFNLVMDFYMPVNNWVFSRPFFFLVHAIAMSSTCYNPFLYAWLNENFRKEFKLLLPCYSNSLRSSSVSNTGLPGIQMIQKNTLQTTGESVIGPQSLVGPDGGGSVRKPASKCSDQEEIHL